MKIIDRYLVQLFVRAFLVSFASLVGLYIVIDAFAQLDEFSERTHGVFSLLAVMGQYYMYRVSLFFDRLSGPITTIAAMFTFSWIQRTNELIPLLSAGVPVYRVILPVVIAALGVNGVVIMNQELIIPRIAKQLEMSADDDGYRTVNTHSAYDSRGVLLGGDRSLRQRMTVRPATVLLPPELAGTLVDLRAAEARYIPPGKESPSGGWLLSDVSSSDTRSVPGILQELGPGKYFLYSTLSFDELSRTQHWYQFAGTRDLLTELRKQTNAARTEMAVLVHARLTRPLASITLLFLGLPFVLSGMDRRIVTLVGVSLVISLTFQMFSQFSQRLGNLEYISPTLAAWLPVLVFGSLAIGMFDLVRT